jgi:cytidylate kinase
MRKRLVITIDGPSGAGKSTMAKFLASALGYSYLDTGAMYRAVAYAYARGPDPSDLELFLRDLVLHFVFDTQTQVFLDGEDISRHIRTPEISLLASRLSQDPRVRRYLTKMQRDMGKDGGVVLEGRDTGSVVFPDAEVKFFLDADVNERARRRHVELAARSAGDDLGKVKEEMQKRDRDDSERDIAPLIRPEGALYVDTTGLDIAHVVRILEERVKEAML